MVEPTLDVRKICRTCLRIDADLKSLFNEEGNNGIPISKMIEACTKYPVNDDDEYPNQICSQCIQDTKLAYAFKRQCEKSYETLRSVLNGCKTNIGQALNLEDDRRQISFTAKSDPKEELTEAIPKEKCTQTNELDFNSRKKKSSSSESLNESDQTEHKNTLNKCRICFKVYLRVTHLKRHILIAHPEINSVSNSVCRICEKKFTKPERLKKHLLTCHYEENEIIIPDEPLATNGNDQTKEITYDSQNCMEQLETEKKLDDIQSENFNLSTDSRKSTSNTEEDKITVPYRNETSLNILDFENYDSDFANDHEAENICTGEDDESDDDEKPLAQLRPQNLNTNEIDQNNIKDDGKTNECYLVNPMIERKLKSKKNLKEEKLHKCDVCAKNFTRATHLKRHALTHSEEKPYSCNVCNKGFTRIDHLNLHMHHHSDVKPFVCDVCNRGFIRAEHLRKHKESRHGHKILTPKSEFCEICKKGFTTPKYLQIHMRSHVDRTWNCKFCSETFKTKPELSEHLKQHTNEKPFLCSECGLRFVRNDYLVIHMRRHKGEKPYKCKFCGKGFPRATDLTVHERYHTGEKTHLCTVCGKGFQRAYNLLVHTRVHTGERPYQCPHCSKRFAQGNDLKAHVRRHTGERFKCEICGDGFIQGYHLTQHKRTVHGIDMKSHIRRVEKFTTPVEQEQQMLAIKEATMNNDNIEGNNITITSPESATTIISDINVIKLEAKIDNNEIICLSTNQDGILQQDPECDLIHTGTFNVRESVFYTQVEPKLKLESDYD